MTFGYVYKASEGTRHEATLEAKSRESAFAELRARGIKPIKVWEVHSRFYVPLRVRLVVILALALAASLFYAVRAYRIIHSPTFSVRDEGTARPRHQIYGDPATLEDMERDSFASIFPDLGERILACYAIPGRPYATSLSVPPSEGAKALSASMHADVDFAPSDSPEATELKRIVQGMKEELRWYVGDGMGTAATYLRRLRERQDEEMHIYERTRKELENCTDDALREERNAALRALGLRTIPRPRKRQN